LLWLVPLFAIRGIFPVGDQPKSKVAPGSAAQAVFMKIQPVILCGGSGTRLWPLSREQYPKQLLALLGSETMLQQTALRLNGSSPTPGCELLPPIVVGNEEYRFITAEQLRQSGIADAELVLEPVGRNTAPALAVAALSATVNGEDPILVVMPADHVITEPDAFRAAVAQGALYADSGKLVTFGIKPTHPEPGYGYIRCGIALEGAGGGRAIRAFVEKPDLSTAEQYVAAGDYLWNAGIFMMRASTWIEQLGVLRADMLKSCRASFAACVQDADFTRVGSEAFVACPSESIDYAVMEKLPDGLGVVLPLSAGWSDVGAWDALWQICEKDAAGNSVQGDVMMVDSRDTLAVAQSRLVACVGLCDAVVVETPDAVLVAHKSRMQNVKDIVARLKKQGRTEANAHRKIYRPWGYYDSIDAGSRFQVKRIVVNPGAALSLQMHHHRAEHWVVVRGTARVTRGDETFLVSENESTYIPLGTRHRLDNPGKVLLEIIEVQSGAYLGEDDIVRFEDKYNRTERKIAAN
jgi:mannose-1-phosphate guanylyltransferase/mannose-6-phosphate isomerase